MGMSDNDSTDLVNDFNSFACPSTANRCMIKMWSLSFRDVWSSGRVSCIGEGPGATTISTSHGLREVV